MSERIIDTAMAKRMVEASAIGGASIIGQPGGWSVMLKVGTTQTPLGAQRTNKPRTWRSLDRCIEYVKSELHIARFDMLDATAHSAERIDGKTRDDSAERMRRVHAAAAHDKWVREKVQATLDNPGECTPHDEVMAAMRSRIEARVNRPPAKRGAKRASA